MVREKIINWLKNYNDENKMSGFVVGISGGIDSALVSTLCAETGLKTIAVSIPINQNKTLHERSLIQQNWLLKNYKNVSAETIDLSETFNVFKSSVNTTDLGYANSKSRLRMIALYAVASRNNSLVVGTGNKIEDFGVGFFTKYGDGGVDVSPIADLPKTQVFFRNHLIFRLYQQFYQRCLDYFFAKS
jgi:NAD+ synthase